MSTQNIVITVVLIGAFFCLPLFAAESAQGAKHPHGNFKEGMAQNLKEKLSLTDEQFAKVQAILKASEPTMEAERQKFHEQSKARREQIHEQINAVLNEEQKQKYAKMQEEKKKRFEEWKEKRGEKGEHRWGKHGENNEVKPQEETVQEDSAVQAVQN